MQAIAIVGNPNSGKTTLFNALSSSQAAVGNYPGITVEQRRARGTGPLGRDIEWIDVPGIYSLQCRSPEEEITLKVLLGQIPQQAPTSAWLYVLDSTQLRRSLLLFNQLLDFQHPMVVALTYLEGMPPAYVTTLQQQLEHDTGVAVVPVSNTSTADLQPLVQACLQAPHRPPRPRPNTPWPAPVAQALEQIELTMADQANLGLALWMLAHATTTSTLQLPPQWLQRATQLQAEAAKQGPHLSQTITVARYRQIDRWLAKIQLPYPTASFLTSQQWTDRIDRWLLHPIWGGGVFALLMFMLFQMVFQIAEPTTDWVGWGIETLQSALHTYLPKGQFRALLLEGLLPGLGAVAIFVPQIAVLFAGILFLEESGYLSRAAALMDRWMGAVGLPGKAFVPLLSSFACAVPGIMATRTLERKQDRMTTLLIAPFMSCSARLPVYTLVISALFAHSEPLFGFVSIGGLLMFSMYGLGMAAAWITAWLLRRHVWRAEKAPLLLALPLYKWPSGSLLRRYVMERCRLFLRDTGPVIIAISLLLWALLSYPRLPADGFAQATVQQTSLHHLVSHDEQAQKVQAQLHYSYAGRMGHMLEPLIQPLGFDWRIGIGLIASFAAREVLVGTLGQIYALGSKINPDAPVLHQALLLSPGPNQQPALTPLVGLSLMVFFVLAMQCMSTFAVVRRETGTWFWPISQLLYMNSLAYGASFLVYQTGLLLGWQ